MSMKRQKQSPELGFRMQNALDFLRSNGPSQVETVQKHLKLSPSGTWIRLKRLAAIGLVDRVRSEVKTGGRPKFNWRAINP